MNTPKVLINKSVEFTHSIKGLNKFIRVNDNKAYKNRL